jgi:hypothetical protein
VKITAENGRGRGESSTAIRYTALPHAGTTNDAHSDDAIRLQAGFLLARAIHLRNK